MHRPASVAKKRIFLNRAATERMLVNGEPIKTGKVAEGKVK